MPEMTATRTRTPSAPSQSPALRQPLAAEPRVNPALAWTGALLTLGVAWIHVVDQGGLPGSKSPSYVGWGYWALELVAVLVAAALILKPTRNQITTWLVAAGVAAGPIAGYVLSRGPGLPGYTDDRGVWTEPIGLLSLVVEGLLLLLALSSVRTLRKPGRTTAGI